MFRQFRIMGRTFFHIKLRPDFNKEQIRHHQSDHRGWCNRRIAGIQIWSENSIQERSIRISLFSSNRSGWTGNDQIPEKAATWDSEWDVRAIGEDEKKRVRKDASRYVQSEWWGYREQPRRSFCLNVSYFILFSFIFLSFLSSFCSLDIFGRAIFIAQVWLAIVLCRTIRVCLIFMLLCCLIFILPDFY